MLVHVYSLGWSPFGLFLCFVLNISGAILCLLFFNFIISQCILDILPFFLGTLAYSF